MFGDMQKICILAVAIAVIAVFTNANDLTKFQATATTTPDAAAMLKNTTEERNRKTNIEINNTQMNVKDMATTTTTSTILKVNNNNEQNRETARKTTIEQTVLDKIDKRERVKEEEEAAAERAVKSDTSTQMNTTETVALEYERRYGHDNATANDDKITTTTTSTIEEKKLKIEKSTKSQKKYKWLSSIYHLNLAKLVNGTDQTTTTTTTTVSTENIKDLYALEKSNEEQKNIVFTVRAAAAAEHRQNLMPNEVEQQQQQQEYTKIIMNKRQTMENLNDFTGKLLAEEDGGLITEIEQKFRINEAASSTTVKPTTYNGTLESLDAAIAKVFAAAAAKEGISGGTQLFLDRRVKKSFDIPRSLSETSSMPTLTTDAPQSQATTEQMEKKIIAAHFPRQLIHEFTFRENKNKNKSGVVVVSRRLTPRQQLVLTNQNLNSEHKQLSTAQTTHSTLTSSSQSSSQSPSSSSSSVLGEVLSAVALPTQTESSETLERVKWRLKPILPDANKNKKQLMLNINFDTSTTPAPTHTHIHTSSSKSTTTTKTTAAFTTNTSKTNYKASQAKTSVNANVPSRTTTTTVATKTTTSTSSSADISTTTTRKAIVESRKATVDALSQHRATNPTKSSSKPISRPRTLSQLQLKINSLECEIANVPPDAHLWRGNETHELLLPLMVSKSYVINNIKQKV